MTTGKLTREIGLLSAIALVMGNMIGAGVFMLPASLAPYGGISIIGWLVSAAGAVLLAFVFAQLARQAPAAGGPYAYTRLAFGDTAGFLVAWVYWLSVWSANAAIAIAFVGYLDPFVPGLGQNPALAASLAVGAIWLLAAINIAGVREAGLVQIVTTVLKVLPLAAIGIAGIFALDSTHFAVTDSSAGTMGRHLFATVALTAWAFSGMDAATIVAGHVRNPERTIPRATLIGTLLTAAIYIVGTAAVMGVVPPATLAVTTAPFADAARRLFGDVAALAVAAGAAISAFGALNGWTLVVGQLPEAAARDGLFPAAFGRTARTGTPATGIVISAALATILIAANYTRGLVGLFTFTILLSALGALIPYAFTALAGFLIEPRTAAGRPNNISRKHAIVCALAFLYVLAAIAGAGFETLFWGLLLLLAGLPFYVWVVLTRRRRTSDE